MQKTIITLSVICLALSGRAQIKIWNGGKAAFGSTSSTPNKAIDVFGTGGIQISRTDTGTNAQNNEIFFLDNGQIRSYDNNHRIIFDRSNNILELREFYDIVFSPGSSGTRTQKMTFNRNGHVGVGISSLTPKTRFDLYYDSTSAFSSGPVYGAHFVNAGMVSGSTNPYTYGVYGAANGAYNSNNNAYNYGLAASATNAYNVVGLSSVVTNYNGNGKAYGGYFNTSAGSSSGAGNVYGVYSTIGANAGGANYCFYGTTSNSTSGANYGIYVTAAGTKSGCTNYGVSSTVGGSGSTNVAIFGHVNSFVAGNYAGLFFGDVYTSGGSNSGTGYFVASDQQFKTHIDTIGNASAILKKLKPRRYFMDTTANNGMHFSGKKQYGFIAQELNTILPELVYTVKKPADIDTAGNVIHPAITHLSVNYDAIIPLLTAAMQSQQNQIDSLKQIITNCCTANSGGNNRTIQGSGNSYQGTGNTTNTNTSSQSVNLSNANTIVLNQNVPNPFAEQTTISYSIPAAAGNAQILFYDANGRQINSVTITTRGAGQLIVYANDLTNGTYSYTLVVDGKIIDTKKMIKQ